MHFFVPPGGRGRSKGASNRKGKVFYFFLVSILYYLHKIRAMLAEQFKMVDQVKRDFNRTRGGEEASTSVD